MKNTKKTSDMSIFCKKVLVQWSYRSKSMKITTQHLGLKLIVTAEGRIDSMTAVDFGTKINDFLDDSDEDINELVLDLAKVDYISSIGLRVILELQKRMSRQGSLTLINVTPPVLEVFEMTGFTNILTIE